MINAEKNYIIKNHENFFKINYFFFFIALFHWILTIPIEKFYLSRFIFYNIKFAIFKFLLIILFWQVIGFCIKKYKEEKNFRYLIHLSLIYFVFSIITLILIWPGNWFSDELSIISSLRNGHLVASQHVLTSFFYLSALALFPTLASITILQLLIISLIIGYFINYIFNVMHGSKWSVLGYLPFLLLPVLNQNYLTFRATLYSYLILLFIVCILFWKWQNKKITSCNSIFLAFIAAIITNWRGEGIYFIIAAPIIFIFVFWKLLAKKQIIIFISAFALVFTAVQYLQNQEWDKNTHSYYNEEFNRLSTYIAPLVTLVLQAKKDGREDLFMNVKKYINIDLFDKYTIANDIYWSFNVLIDRKPFNKSNQDEVIQDYILLIKEYPNIFLKERWDMLQSSMDSTITSIDALADGYRNPESFLILQHDRFSRYINQTVRANISTILAMNPWPKAKRLAHNPLIPFGLLLSITLLTLIKRDFVLALAAASVIPTSILVFLSAPVNHFMYYFSIYLVGYSLFAASILIGCWEKFSSKHQESKRA